MTVSPRRLRSKPSLTRFFGSDCVFFVGEEGFETLGELKCLRAVLGHTDTIIVFLEDILILQLKRLRRAVFHNQDLFAYQMAK